MNDFRELFLPELKNKHRILIWNVLNEELKILLKWVNRYLKECSDHNLEVQWTGERTTKDMIFYLANREKRESYERSMGYVKLKFMTLIFSDYIYRCEWSSSTQQEHRGLKCNLLLRSIIVLFVGLLWNKLEKPRLYMTSDPIISPISERTVRKYFGFQYVEKVIEEKSKQYKDNRQFLNAAFYYKPHAMFAKYDLSLVDRAIHNLMIFLTQSKVMPKCQSCGNLKKGMKWPDLSIFNELKIRPEEIDCTLASSSAAIDTFEAEFIDFLDKPRKYNAQWRAEKKQIWIKGKQNDRWGLFWYKLTTNKSGSISAQRLINGAAMPAFTPEERLQPTLQKIWNGRLLPLFHDMWG